MFESATSYGPQSHRVWTTCMGMTGQAILLASVILGSIWFPAALPRPLSPAMWICAPRPQAVAPAVRAETVTAPKMRPLEFVGSRLYEPAHMPAKVVMIEDPPLPPGAGTFGGEEAARTSLALCPAFSPRALPWPHPLRRRFTRPRQRLRRPLRG
jgi:hypothetical protein